MNRMSNRQFAFLVFALLLTAVVLWSMVFERLSTRPVVEANSLASMTAFRACSQASSLSVDACQARADAVRSTEAWRACYQDDQARQAFRAGRDAWMRYADRLSRCLRNPPAGQPFAW